MTQEEQIYELQMKLKKEKEKSEDLKEITRLLGNIENLLKNKE